MCAIAAPVAHAGDPGRWTITGRSTVPLEYYQGLAGDAPTRPTLFFTGIDFGLYRTDADLHETGRNLDAIPPQVHATEGYDHIGDPAYDAREGGRVLLPFECYYPGAAPGQPDPNNTCRTGSIGVADPRTLQLRYYVKLDPAEIPKAMWLAVSPDGRLVWTQTGNDLIAYRLDDVNAANAAPAGAIIHPVRRLVNAKPPSGITGAVFYQGRLFVPGGDSPIAFQMWSIDVDTGDRRLEFERAIVGESEGVEVFQGLGGTLHWLVAPYNTQGIPSEGPFYTSTLLHLVPTAASTRPIGGVPFPSAPPRIRLTAAPRTTRAGQVTRFAFRATATIAGRVRAVGGATVSFGRRKVRTDRAGRA
ncbi:MAG: hypothetical protein M3067_03015, partial [Chloroflexota bacterium]|nr:hypothetical protein [Chloroflexota bacterium]